MEGKKGNTEKERNEVEIYRSGKYLGKKTTKEKKKKQSRKLLSAWETKPKNNHHNLRAGMTDR